MVSMNTEDIIKALDNKHRRQILHWLKTPEEHFPKQHTDIKMYGVCCGAIHEKIKLSQSTTSLYLKMLEKSGLLISIRKGQWTFYKRNEKVIHSFAEYIQREL